MTCGSKLRAPVAVFADGLAGDRHALRRESCPPRFSSPIIAPARRRHGGTPSPRNSPAGWMFASSGMSMPDSSPNPPYSSSTPMCRAMAMRCGRTVRRSADGGVHDDGVFKCLARQYAVRREVFVHHVDDARARA